MSTTEGRVRVGKATVSWGPRFYGKPMIIANAPLDDLDDLVTALTQAKCEITGKCTECLHPAHSGECGAPITQTIGHRLMLAETCPCGISSLDEFHPNTSWNKGDPT